MSIIGALPNVISNGQTADAVPLMADLNYIVNQVNANAQAIGLAALLASANSFTQVQSGVAATGAANFPIASQIQNSVFTTFQSTLGTNALTARVAALALPAWPTDGVFTFLPAQTNTGPANLTVDSAGSSIIFSMGSTLVGGELRAGVPAELKRDATRLNLLNPANVRFDLASSTGAGGIRVLISSTPAPIMLGRQPSRTILTSGTGATYTTPPNATRIFMRAVGGGAGSGNAAATSGIQASAGGGGGGGSYAEKLFLVPAPTYVYTVGAGGSAGVNGGQTSFGVVTAPGGTAGSDGAANNNIEAGIAGGAGGVVGANGDLHVPGSDGGFGIEAGSGYAVGGPGGASGLNFGGATFGGRTVTQQVGVAGKNYGGGAAGAANSVSQGTAAGAAGAGGIILVDEFYN